MHISLPLSPVSQDPAASHPLSRVVPPGHRLAVTGAALLLCASLDIAAAQQQAELISRPSNPNYFGAIGALPSGASCSMSADGTRIAFPTDAFNLFEDDRNRVADVVVHDLMTGSLEPVSLTSDGAQVDGSAQLPSIDGSGRYVLFNTDATNLGGSGSTRVYRHDRQNGQTVLASIDIDGVPFISSSLSWDLSLDGNLAQFSAEDQLWLHDFTLGQTESVSPGFDGQPADEMASAGVLSDSGGIVVFESAATNLVPGDTNGVRDVFVFDRSLGTVERLNGQGGAQPDGASDDPDVSGDGRWITFSSIAGNLVGSDTEGRFDVFLHDRHTGSTIRLSEDAVGSGGNGSSQRPKISADGRFVVFESSADNLLPGLSGNEPRLFLFDRIRDQLDRVAATAGAPTRPCIVSTGNEVAIAFRGVSHPVLPAGINPAQMLFESFDPTTRGAPATFVLSAREPALPVWVGSGDSDPPAVSANGTHLAFSTTAENLIGRSGFRDQIVRLDLESGQIAVVSNTLDGDFDATWVPASPSISGNGNRVAFVSRSSLIAPGITNDFDDVFVRNLQLGQTRRVSVDTGGVEGNGASTRPQISANGNSIVFESLATNLVPDDSNGRRDVFVHDLDTSLTERVSINSAGAETDQESNFPSISADGRFVVFQSRGNLLDVPTSIPNSQIWLRDRQLQQTELISVAADGTPGNGSSSRAQISADGRWIAFQSTFGNLDPAFPGFGGEAVYLHDRQSGTTRLVSLDENQQPLADSLISNLYLAAAGQALTFARTIDPGGDLPTPGADVPEVYLVRIDLQQNVRIEPRTIDGQPPNAEVFSAGLSANGRMLYLVSPAGNLVPDMLNDSSDIYRIDLDRVFGDGFEG